MTKTTLRCAIYTRKSSEEGLDQAFNSLHAQREACEAYVLSQAGEGWSPLKTLYDDGGISGGTMERPGLKRLLADIDRGIVDVVVVYKVDRLTRSLADFAKIVERFDQRQVSFVSVTQAFNTTNSMGRLTLNVLLSFAQFEREVTGERIRDKIAASKKKGMWMGGIPPIGYDVPTDAVSRALVVNPVEAEEVRELFRRYLELGNVHDLKAELDAQGRRTPIKANKKGGERGGAEWSRGALFYLLKNRAYRGEIRHRDEVYPGNHPPIVEAELFNAVQDVLQSHRIDRRDRPLQPDGAPLTGKIFDPEGVPMTPTIAYGKAGRKYRYYVSRPLQTGSRAPLDRSVVRRISAGAIESLVVERLTACGLLEARSGWARIRKLVIAVRLASDHVAVELTADGISEARLAEARQRLVGAQKLILKDGRSQMLQLILPGRPVFRGGRTWGASPDGGALVDHQGPDVTLVAALRRGHALVHDHGLGAQAPDIRGGRGIEAPYARALGRLAYLAPDIQAALVSGEHPPSVTLEKLLGSDLPISWSAQRTALGFENSLS